MQVTCSVTRKVLRESQHQVSLLVLENRQLSGVREQAVMPAWTSNVLDANLVEFRSIQVGCPAVHAHAQMANAQHGVQVLTQQRCV